MGLDRIDRRVLECIIEKYDGGPVGIDNHCGGHQRRERYHRRCV